MPENSLRAGEVAKSEEMRTNSTFTSLAIPTCKANRCAIVFRTAYFIKKDVLINVE